MHPVPTPDYVGALSPTIACLPHCLPYEICANVQTPYQKCFATTHGLMANVCYYVAVLSYAKPMATFTLIFSGMFYVTKLVGTVIRQRGYFVFVSDCGC